MKAKGILYIILSGVIFGMMPIGAKVIYANGGNSYFLTLVRFSLSLLPLYLLDRMDCRRCGIEGRTRLSRRQIGQLILLSAGFTATPAFLFLSYNYISSGLSTTLHFVYPVLVLVGCALFFREKIGRRELVCCALCMAGVLSFYTPGDSGNIFGVCIALLSGITYALYIIILAKSGLQMVLRRYQLTFCVQGAGAVALLVVSTAVGALHVHVTLLGWVLICFFTFGTTTATIFFQMGTKLCGPQYASLLSTFEPLTSVVAGVVLLHEGMTLRSGLGIACVLASVLLLAWKKGAKSEGDQAAEEPPAVIDGKDEQI
ncbi:DMT family transporter [Oscillibacter hominis]|uniref:DMT family transporter n=1 Tax=Oscillibacter hominis TaxID=2763056 RepID=A0A7G9B352_9FIRM|nr:DMT family transporter [Oscillibacter hominis]QNL43983.1 DMT family transporter [Oscillibacter hominis]